MHRHPNRGQTGDRVPMGTIEKFIGYYSIFQFMRLYLVMLIFTAALFYGCASKELAEVEKMEDVGKIEVKSVFGNMERIPTDYTCDGADISPPLTIEGISEKAVSMAIIMDDPDAPIGTFTHWIAWNIPPADKIPGNIPKEKAVTQPVKMLQAKNDFGRFGYGGPCPPKGKPHRYFFKVYVLDTMLGEDIRSKEELLGAMEGHIIQYGELVGLYGR